MTIYTDFKDFKFLTELTGSRIRDNRRKIGEIIKQTIPESEAFIWLLDNDSDKTYLALSYTSIDQEKIENNDISKFVPAYTSGNDTDFLSANEAVMSFVTDKISSSIGFGKHEIQHSVIHDALTKNETRDAIYKDEVLGWLSIIYPQRTSLDKEQERVLQLSSRVLSMLLRQGRDARILHAIELVHERISKIDSLGDLISEISQDLSRICNMPKFVMRSSNCNKRLIGGDRNNPEAINALDKMKIQSSVGKPINVGPKTTKVNSFISTEQQLNLSPESPPYIYMPLVEKGVEIGNISLNDRNTFLDETTGRLMITHEMYLLEKETGFLSNAVSSTDLKVCESVSRALQGTLSASLYEKKFQKVSRYFQKLDIASELDVNKFKNFISRNLIDCVNLDMVTCEKNGEYVLITPPTEHAPNLFGSDYSDRISEYLTSFHTGKGAIEDGIRVGSDIRTKRNLFEFHLHNSFNKSRLLTFELNSNLIALNDFHILHHLMSELQLYFKSADSLDQRLSDLAQVRHAIKAPLAAANASIEEFHETMIVKSRTEKMWKSLRTEERDWELLYKARDLGETAMLLAESGRYLFSEIDHNSLNIKDFNLNDLVKSVLGTFDARKKTDNVIIKSAIAPPEGAQNGDKELLYVAFANLVDNAIKYSVRSASNSYYARFLGREYVNDSAVVEVELKLFNDYYRFSVTNVGAHIPDDDMEIILRPFGRSKQYHNLHLRHGTGIGLPATQKILTAHHQTAALQLSSRQLKDDKRLALNKFFFEMPFRIGRKTVDKND